MKKMKKFLALLIAVALVLGMGVAVFAQDKAYTGTDKGTATITVNNASKGVTYKVYKLFNATVSTKETDGVSDSIAYTGIIPDSLSAYFTADEKGNITATDAAKDATDPTQLSSNAVNALKAWADSDAVKDTYLVDAESDGSALTFSNLPYGFYVITSTQNNGAAITVDSTRPNATVNDKNSTTSIDDAKKYAGEDEAATDNNVYIGQTVNYTVSLNTANYEGAGTDAKKVTAYTIADDFANNVLTNVRVTSITVGGTAPTTTVKYTDSDTALTVPFDWTSGKTISIAWTDANGNSVYNNGAKLKVTYTATVAATAAIDGSGNTNKATISCVTEGGGTPTSNTVEDTIYTYAVAIKKVDQDGYDLPGATFQLPFYVKKTADTEDNAYIYAFDTLPATFPEGDSADNYTNSLTTPDNGLIIIKGVKDGTYSFEETDPPKGYNKLAAPVQVKAEKTGHTTTSTTTFFDKDGNKVDEQQEDGFEVLVSIDELSAGAAVAVNKTGTELPSTGGIGTTIFYITGAILVIGAGVVLVTRRRMNVQ